MRIRYRRSGKLYKAKYIESRETLSNPGCGWYHVYTFRAQPPPDGRPVEEEIWLDDVCRKERLALVLIDIGSFRCRDLSEAALLHVAEIMKFFQRAHKQMILRVTYDTGGNAAVREPGDLSRILVHMEQIGSVIRGFLADILVIQGIFVGNWGEMHGSRYMEPRDMLDLIHTLYRVTEGKCFLAVRTPAQWRQITGSLGSVTGLRQRLALFNDGIFGSPTDLGTYGTAGRAEAGRYGKWNREEELRWQDSHMGSAPNGGEALGGASPVGYGEAAERFRKMHLTYLNSIYRQEQLALWKGETVKTFGCWKGVSGYDYIGRHLGYRFVIRNVVRKGAGQLVVTVWNCGFSGLTEEADCFLLIETEDGETVRSRVDTDARDWRAGKKTKVPVLFSPEAGVYKRLKLFLRLERRADGTAIRFANQGAGDQILLGELGK